MKISKFNKGQISGGMAALAGGAMARSEYVKVAIYSVISIIMFIWRKYD
jgi:hypothetical protein